MFRPCDYLSWQMCWSNPEYSQPSLQLLSPPCEKIVPETGSKPKQGTGAWRAGSAVTLGTWGTSDDLGCTSHTIPHKYPRLVTLRKIPIFISFKQYLCIYIYIYTWKYHQAYGLTWTWTRNHRLTGVQPGLTHLRSEEISEMMFFEWTFLAGEKATML